MYISGGENVYPAEIENVLYGMDQIAEVAVIGVPDSQWGEVGCAVIALKPGQSLDLSDIGAFVQGKLASFKQPRHVAFVEALPRNATGKVLKFQLRTTIPETLTLQ
jgi:fatty-acyl-CoA synthase